MPGCKDQHGDIHRIRLRISELAGRSGWGVQVPNPEFQAAAQSSKRVETIPGPVGVSMLLTEEGAQVRNLGMHPGPRGNSYCFASLLASPKTERSV